MYSNPSNVDILIMCALKDEFDQLLQVNNGIHEEWREFNLDNGRNAAYATFKTSSDSMISICATWVASMGRESTQAVVGTIISQLKPKCLAMSGICAGRRNKTELGDVIFADRLWSYDAGKKIVENGKEVFQGDMLPYKPSELIVQNMQRMKSVFKNQDSSWMNLKPQLSLEEQENWVLKHLLNKKNPVEQTDFDENCPNWSEVIQRLWNKGWVDKPTKLTVLGKEHIQNLIILNPKELPKASEFSVHVAPIATGATVTEDDGIFNSFSSFMRKVLGLDMEGSGLAASAEAYNLPFILAKGVSDFADTYKDDRYRIFAARASAELLILLLRNSDFLFSSNNIKKESISHSNPKSTEIIEYLADLYPNFEETQVLWEQAGGRLSDLEAKSRPLNRWHTIWKKVNQGAQVTPQALLQAIYKEYPHNSVIKSLLDLY